MHFLMRKIWEQSIFLPSLMQKSANCWIVDGIVKIEIVISSTENVGFLIIPDLK